MNAFITENFVLLGVGLLVIALRLYARVSAVGITKLQADDYLMVAAAVTYSVETYLAYSVGAFWRGLANNGMTNEQRAAVVPESEEWWLRVNGSKTQVAGWSTYTLLLWLLKASMCAFYLRLTAGLAHFKIRVYIGFGLILSTWLVVFLSIMFGCMPFEKNWQIYPDPGNLCQPAISKINVLVTVVLNVLTDMYLLSIPLPMLWQASLKPAKKAGLMVLFGMGLFVTLAGILRCVLILTDPINGAQQAGSWAVRETFVAVITSNIPMIFSVMKRFTGGIFTSIRSITRSGGTSRRPQGGSNGMIAGDNFNDVPLDNRRGARSVNPLPTANESEESIYNRARHEAEAAANLPPVMGQAAQGDVKYEHTSGGSASESSSIVGGVLPAGRIRKDTEVTVNISEDDRAKVGRGGQNNTGSFPSFPGDLEKFEREDGPSVFRRESQQGGRRRSKAPGGRI
ncbi:hypothetical protein MAPG_02857 [Magnaporthiopsis poae ATCC 64411]|uniref:Rhodopsin domain-containing protein n=1 Tax=Magnaporthiopsis poae (strain ATCC 64411 / 73-15) TaxID=644358 RepID=A0A0C4CSC8_MAGP6|nr:hypothetical protein, variant [Magnaporthiopsis poae ATCC 64411]KLU83807.1 hypothetical protein MAPG_02857 [Magnaporthiopsis poae ATCC 64411]